MTGRGSRNGDYGHIAKAVAALLRTGVSALFDHPDDVYRGSADGTPGRAVPALSGEARELWVAFFDSHNQEAVELAGDLGAAYSKLEGYCARIALVLELVEWAFDDRRGPVPKEISGRSMARAIELTGWFKHEAKRVYAMLEGGRVAEDPTLKAINAAGGSITARDLARSSSRFKVTAEAEQELERLVRAGLGNWERVKPGAKGGRPTRRFRLNTGATSNL